MMLRKTTTSDAAPLWRGIGIALTLLLGGLIATPAAHANSVGNILYQKTDPSEYVGYGRIIRLAHNGGANGTLLATFEHWHTNGVTTPAVIRKSTDNGQTWTTLANVYDPQNSSTIWQPFLFEMPQAMGGYPAGTLVLAFNAIEGNQSELKLFHSLDGGATWQYSNTFETGINNGHGVWEPFLMMDPAGRLICYFSDERQAPTYSQFLGGIASTDGGDTWGGEFPVVYHPGSNVRPGMASVTQLPNGQYILAYENGGDNGYSIYTKTSTDGVNWGTSAADFGTRVSTADGRYPTGSPYIVWTPSGGPMGQLVLGAQVCHNSSDGSIAYENSEILYVNNSLGNGPWSWIPSPFLANIGDSQATPDYSPALLISTDGGSVRQVTHSGDERTDTSSAGVLPFSDAFASGSEAGWLDYGGNWAVSGGAYNNLSGGAGDKAIAGSTGWTNYTLSADVRVNSAGQAGLLFRASNPGVGADSVQGYYVAINSPDGTVFVGSENYNWTELGRTPIPGGVAVGTWYHITVNVSGPTFTVSAQPTAGGASGNLTINDATFPRGAVGVRTFNTTASWSNFAVTAGGADVNGIVSGAAYTIKNVAANLNLDDTGWSTNPGLLELWDAWGGPPQQWMVTYAAPGAYSLTNVVSGLCLDDPNGSANWGTQQQQFYPNLLTPQQWLLQPQGDGSYKMTNVAAGLCLDDPNGSSTHGVIPQLWPDNGATAQRWVFTGL